MTNCRSTLFAALSFSVVLSPALAQVSHVAPSNLQFASAVAAGHCACTFAGGSGKIAAGWDVTEVRHEQKRAWDDSLPHGCRGARTR